MNTEREGERKIDAAPRIGVIFPDKFFVSKRKGHIRWKEEVVAALPMTWNHRRNATASDSRARRSRGALRTEWVR